MCNFNLNFWYNFFGVSTGPAVVAFLLFFVNVNHAAYVHCRPTIAATNSPCNLHTKFDFVALDIYSCSGRTKAKNAIEYLVEVLEPKEVRVKEVERFK